MSLSLSWQSLPEKPGIYLFKGKNSEILYVGKAVNLKKRVSSYFSLKNLGQKTEKLVSEIKEISYITVDSEIEALLLEANLIKKYQPKFNVDFKDGKAYPFIKITTSEEYPRVTTSRRIENDKDIFFGPYPQSKVLYFILRTIRRIFPYRSCRLLPKKPCLYYYLNLCPGVCIHRSPQVKIKYQRTIEKIRLFLELKKADILKELEKEMRAMVKKENFEEAQKIKERIERFKEILMPVKKPFDYLSNPNLLEDVRKEEISDLEKYLKIELNQENFRAEGYDISNIAGAAASGSMVVFINGEAHKDFYRRFRIKGIKKPNDLMMIKEVIKRRLTHKEWPYPDLLVIDGGKNQVKAALMVLKRLNIERPVLGWAKNTENFYFASKKKAVKKIKIPLNTPAYRLLNRIINEAHRFAHQYYLKIKEKMLLLN